MPTLTGLERIITLQLPLREKVNKRDYEAINLNIYRNQHHYKRNNQKKAFHERMKKPLAKLPKLGKIWLHYEIYPKTRRRLDTMNPGSVIDKFFSDALVECGILEDDNYEFVVFNSFCVVGVDKENPRCDVTIIELEESEDMKLSMTAQLSADDLREAAAAWVSEQTGQTATADDITLSADVTATAILGDAPVEEAEAPAKPKRKSPTKKAAAKPTTEEVVADVEPSVPDSSDSDGAGPVDAGEEETVPAEVETEAAPEVDADQPAADSKPVEGKKSKNLFADKSDGSSKGSETPAAETTPAADTEEAAVKPAGKKKSSIFDQ